MAATVNILISAENQASAALKGVQKDLNTLKTTGKEVGQGLKDFGGALTVGVTAPIVAFGGAAMKAITDLNAGLANVGALGVGEERLQQLKTNIQDIAIETGKMTDDLTGGLYQVVSAFGDTADTAEILRINAKAAAAGLAETTDAINLTSAVTKAYGDTNAAAVQHVADMSLATVRMGQTTFPELAASMGKVTPIAAALGVSQAELFAQMATLTGVTGGAAEVSTQLRASYQAILAPTKDMSSAMTDVATSLDKQGKLAGGEFTNQWRDAYQELLASGTALAQLEKGLVAAENATKPNTKAVSELKKSVKEAKGEYEDAYKVYEEAGAALGPTIVKSVGLNDALKLLSGTAGGNTDTLRKMFGSVEALTAVLALSGGQAGAFEEKLAEMQKVTGETDSAFEAQTNGINKAGFAMEQAKVKMQVFLQKVGDGLAPVFLAATTILSQFGDILLYLGNSFASLAPSAQMMVVAIAGIAAAAGPVMYAVGWLITAFSEGGALTAGISGIGAALGALLSPIGLVVAGVGFLAAAIYNDWGGVGTFVSDIVSGVGDTLSALSEYFVAVVDDGDVLNDWLTHLPESLQPATQWFGNLVSATLNYRDAVLDAGFGSIESQESIGLFPAAIQPVIGWLDKLTGALQSLAGGQDIQALQTNITTAFSDIGASIKSFFSGDISLGGLASAVSQGFSDIKSAISAFFGGADFGAFLKEIKWSEFVEKLSWENVVGTATLVWSDYISPLLWDGWLTVVSWADWLTSLDWTKIITTAIDWATWIPALSWAGFVTVVDWALYIGSIAWSGFISVLNWLDATGEKIDWSSYVSVLSWENAVKAIEWASYIVSFTWDSFITKLEWTGTIEKLTSWGDYIKEINWGNFVIMLLDWATWIPALAWNGFVAIIDWAAWLVSLDWGGYVSTVDWSQYIAAAFSWSSYIVAVAWADWIPAAFSWSSYVFSLTWSSFVSKLNWPSISWPGFSTFVSHLSWPSISWPGWGSFIPAFPGWPDISSMVQNAIDSVSSYLPGNATGTSYFAGGLTWVGERGPELVNLPSGARVHNAVDSRRMADGGAVGGASITNHIYVQNDIDVEALLFKLEDMQRRRR